MAATLEETFSVLINAALKRDEEILPGYYAIDGKRYRIDLPDTGKWKGFLFLRTGSEYKMTHRIAIRRPDGEFTSGTSDHGKLVLARIVADPLAAMKAYADITSECSICGRKLEDPLSVAIGIGPKCRNQMLYSLMR